MTSLLRPLRIVAVLTVLFVAISHGAPVSSQTPDGSPVANDLITTLSNPLVGNSRARNTQTESAKTNDVAKGNSTKAGTPVAPADESERVLTVSSVTPWVDADGEFQVRFSPTGKVPTGAKLTYTIHQSLVGTMRQSLRTKVAEILAGSSSGKVLQAPKTKVLAEYGDPASGAVLSIPVRSSSSSDSTRAFLPNPGIHPVELVLTTADGPEIWSQTVFLNRLPRAATQDRAGKSRNLEPTRPVTVSMLMPIQSDPAFTPEMKTDFSLESRAILDSATNLLKSAKNSPLTIGLRPDTLAGLSATDEAWAQNLVAAIGNATGAEPEPDTIESPNSTDPPPPDKEPSGSGDSGDSGATSSQGSASILRLPFVALDLGGLANAGATATLRQQLQLGTRVVSSVDRNELKSSTWALDDTVTNEALPMIKAEGFTDVVLPVSRFELDDNLNHELVMTGPVQLDGPGELRAIAYDDLVSQQLSDPSVDPAIRAHDALVVLMANWFSANRDNSRLSAPTAVIVVPATTDPAVISTISSALAGAGPLQAAKGTSLLPPASPSIEEPRTRLTFRPSPDVNRLVADSSESQRQINAVKSMAGSAEPAIETWEFLNAETFSLGMSTEQRLSRHYSIRDQVSLKLGAIEPPAARRVVLAAREATIPLRFRNGLPYEVRLTVRARSPRLDVRFKSSDEVVLQPGENQIDLPVEVQAPGESLLRVQLMTPDGGMVLSSFDIPVRSTSISGVGSALSIISITFLLVWWIRTMRRRRREAARESSSHPSTADAPVSEESSTGTVDESG